MAAGRVKEGRGWVPARAHAEGDRVAKELLRWIEQHDMTIHAVEERIGWGQKTLWEVVQGAQPIRFSHVAAVAEACGFDVRDFYRALAGEGKKGPKEKTPDLTPQEIRNLRRFLRGYKDEIGS